MITRDNYESYFVDYLEGNLPENQIDQFLDFLNRNPDLKEELHLFEEVILPEENIVFQEKQQLHKSATDEIHRFENKAIAYLEHDLDDEERKLFETYLANHPQLKKEYDLFDKTRLIPDLSVQFAAKNKLYQKSAKTVVLNWVARAAAVVVLVWGISSLLQTPNKTEMAQNKVETAETNFKENRQETQVKTEQAPEKLIQEKEKPAQVDKLVKAKPENKHKQNKAKEIQTLPQEQPKDEPNLLVALPVIDAKLEREEELHLAVKQMNTIIQINETQRTMSVEEFLAMRAKKIGKDGLFSAQRIARLGLNIASEISGDRIGYKEKDGKITSVEFESKLMAFSIPLERN